MPDRNLNSAHRAPLGLPLLTIGFCTDLAGEERLRAAGVERIWRRGDGNDCLDDALYEFRDREHGALALKSPAPRPNHIERVVMSTFGLVEKKGPYALTARGKRALALAKTNPK